jgi:uncharacterized membrane protein YfcA
LILLGTWVGKAVQTRIPEQAFKLVVLVFAALGALKLMFL